MLRHAAIIHYPLVSLRRRIMHSEVPDLGPGTCRCTRLVFYSAAAAPHGHTAAEHHPPPPCMTSRPSHLPHLSHSDGVVHRSPRGRWCGEHGLAARRHRRPHGRDSGRAHRPLGGGVMKRGHAILIVVLTEGAVACSVDLLRRAPRHATKNQTCEHRPQFLPQLLPFTLSPSGSAVGRKMQGRGACALGNRSRCRR